MLNKIFAFNFQTELPTEAVVSAPEANWSYDPQEQRWVSDGTTPIAAYCTCVGGWQMGWRNCTFDWDNNYLYCKLYFWYLVPCTYQCDW